MFSFQFKKFYYIMLMNKICPRTKTIVLCQKKIYVKIFHSTIYQKILYCHKKTISKFQLTAANFIYVDTITVELYYNKKQQKHLKIKLQLYHMLTQQFTYVFNIFSGYYFFSFFLHISLAEMTYVFFTYSCIHTNSNRCTKANIYITYVGINVFLKLCKHFKIIQMARGNCI